MPLNPYHLAISATGFGKHSEDVDVRSTVPVTVKSTLAIGESSTVIEVTAADLLESDSTFHTDIDRGLFNRLPLESQSSSLSSLVTLSSPGVAADSNGLFHGLGDHASNSFSIDGQPITDQQSKVFSNQLPSNSVQSIEVISGAPPAEFGGKTSLVIQVTTRSGQGVTHPTGSITASYGTFGSATGSVDLSYGGKNWGNFIEVDGLNTGRFLDPPEFVVFHSKGNEINIFDRIDRTLSEKDSILHLNLNYSRSWFQTPNAYDNLNVQNVVSGGTGPNPVFDNVRQYRSTFEDGKHSTLHRLIRAPFQTTRSSTSGLTSAKIFTTTTRAIILLPISGQYKTRASLKTVPSSIPVCVPTIRM